MKSIHRLFSILLITGLLLGWSTSGSSLANSTEFVNSQTNPSQKIEPQLLGALTAGQADFIVMLAEQADVSAANKLQTKLEKGQFVFDTLVATASRSQADLRSYLDAQGADYMSFYIVNAVWVKGGTLDLAQGIASRADVAAINANHSYQLDEPIDLQLTTAQPEGIESNISFINAPEAWAMGATGQGTVMAGNDTGLNWSHPAIAPHYRGCLNPPTCDQVDHNYNWYDVYAPSNRAPWDDYGHGTHTTGTMVGDDGAGNQIGVAPGAKTIHCKNMQSGYGDDAHFIECFQWDLAPWDLDGANPRPDLAPDAINNSWGIPGGNDNNMREAVDNLFAAGIIVEVSAGNEGSGCQTLRSPGDYLESFTTGSVNHSGGVLPGPITGFSSRGPSALDGDYFPDFMAPGENVRSVWGSDYGYASGTSMAGPHVTALIGLIWSANPALRGQVDATYQIIQDTVVPLTGQNGSNCGGDYTVGPNNDWGYGTIDAAAAVQYAIAMGGAGKINGNVTDEDTGNVVVGANILAEHAEGYVWNILTNANGYYTATVAAGTYTITASAPGYQSEFVYPVDVPEDGVAAQDFVLKYIPNVALTPDAQTKNGTPGTQVSYDLTVTNDAHVEQEIELSVESGWPVEAPTTVGLLGPEESVVVPVVVTIPMNPSIIIGTDVFTMTATGSVGGIAIANGTTNANVTPGVKVAGPGVDGSGSPNTVISYEFTITNTGNYTDSFALTLFGTWPDVLPGGDNTGPVATGATVHVIVLVTVPTGVGEGDKSVTILRATSDINHSTRATGRVTTWAEWYRNLMPLITR